MTLQCLQKIIDLQPLVVCEVEKGRLALILRGIERLTDLGAIVLARLARRGLDPYLKPHELRGREPSFNLCQHCLGPRPEEMVREVLLALLCENAFYIN
jgi:hypothetical protein